MLSEDKIGDYYTGVRRVLTNIFGKREVLSYVTTSEKASKTRRLFFSTIYPEQLEIFCAWQEKSPLNQSESVQEFRFALSEQIRQQIFYAAFVKEAETHIKSTVIIRVLKQLVQQQGIYL